MECKNQELDVMVKAIWREDNVDLVYPTKAVAKFLLKRGISSNPVYLPFLSLLPLCKA